MAYRIDVFDATDKRVAILQEEILTSLDLDIAVDAAPQLTLSLPVSDEKTVWISPLYHIKVWNTEISAYEFSVFRLYNPEIEDGSELSIKATYQGVLTRLSGEYVEDYDTTSAGKPFADVISDLLAYQVNTPAISVGTLEPTPTVAIAVESSDIYAALNSIRKSYGGWFEVDSSYRLNWFEDNTGDPLRRIERRKNLKAISYTPLYDRVANRIYAYGKGEGDARVNLTDAGEAHEYIEDTASQALYGVIAKKKIDKTITHPSTLLKYAQRILNEYKDPPYQYSVDVLNLAETDGYDYSFESLRLDTRVRVVDDLLGVDVNTSIVSMSINLLNPEEISIELSTIKNDLSDLFGDILNIQDIHNSVATQIGAGQVTVQGTFVVEDWVSAGTTKIVGDYLTTGTIQASTITLDNSTGGEGILKSKDYASGSAGWQINGDGDAEFNDVTVRGTLAACTVGTGQTITVNGRLDVVGTGFTQLTVKGATTSTTYHTINNQGFNGYYKSINELSLSADYDSLPGLSIDIPSTASGSNPGIAVTSFKADKAAANFKMFTSVGDPTVPTVKIESSGTTVPALKVTGGANIIGDLDCYDLNCRDVAAWTINCDVLNAGEEVICNRLHLGRNDTYEYFRSTGTHLYWYDENGTQHTLV